MRVSGCVQSPWPASTWVSLFSLDYLYLPSSSSPLFLLPQDTMTWENCPDFSPTDNEQGQSSCPSPRAGACAAVVGTRMYLWSGRDGYKKIWNQQVDGWTEEEVPCYLPPSPSTSPFSSSSKCVAMTCGIWRLRFLLPRPESSWYEREPTALNSCGQLSLQV